MMFLLTFVTVCAGHCVIFGELSNHIVCLGTAASRLVCGCSCVSMNYYEGLPKY